MTNFLKRWTGALGRRTAGESPPEPATADDLALIAALRAGDEEAFVQLIERYQIALVRLALLYVPNPAVAEDVVQETWIGVLRGLERFEGRSSLKTWIFRILVNRAKTRGQREARSVPFSALGDDDNAFEPAVDAARFGGPNNGWLSPPQRWEGQPEAQLLSKETRTVIELAIAGLPPNQREVITLRDIEGWDAAEVCNMLGITESNQRVRLHRARSRVRRVLEGYLALESQDSR